MIEPLCNDEDCYMPAIVVLNDKAYCIADYKKRNGGRI